VRGIDDMKFLCGLLLVQNTR